MNVKIVSANTLIILFNILKGVCGDHLRSSRFRPNNAVRNNFGNRLVRNSLAYEYIMLELLRRRLGNRDPIVTAPQTVNLDNFFNEPQTTRKQEFVTPAPQRMQRYQFTPRRDRFNGTPLDLMNKFSPTRQSRLSPTRQTRLSPTRQTRLSPTRQTRLSPTRQTNSVNRNFNRRNPSSFVSETNTSPRNNRQSRRFDGVISMGREGGFQFQTSNGVNFNVPNKSGKLVIKNIFDGIEMNFVTPRPRSIRKIEEEEFEL